MVEGTPVFIDLDSPMDCRHRVVDGEGKGGADNSVAASMEDLASCLAHEFSRPRGFNHQIHCRVLVTVEQVYVCSDKEGATAANLV